MVVFVVVDRARGAAVSFNDTNGRIGVVGRGGSANGAVWEREIFSFLFGFWKRGLGWIKDVVVELYTILRQQKMEN